MKHCALVDLLYPLLNFELPVLYSYFKEIHYFAWISCLYFEKLIVELEKYLCFI